MLLHKRNATKEVAYEHKKADPADTADAIPNGEFAEVHMSGSCNERSKRTEKRHETRDDDRQATVFREEMIEFRHALRREGFYLARIDYPVSQKARYPIVRGIAQDGRHVENDQAGRQIQTASLSREHTDSEQQRISRQKWEEYNAGLNEHDEKERRVYPNRPQSNDPACNESSRVLKKVYEKVDYLHEVLSISIYRLNRKSMGARQRFLMAASSRI